MDLYKKIKAFLVIVNSSKDKEIESSPLDLSALKSEENSLVANGQVEIIPLDPTEDIKCETKNPDLKKIKQKEEYCQNHPKSEINRDIKKELIEKYIKECENNELKVKELMDMDCDSLESPQGILNLIKENHKPRKVVLDDENNYLLNIDFSKYENCQEEYVKDHQNWSALMDFTIAMCQRREFIGDSSFSGSDVPSEEGSNKSLEPATELVPDNLKMDCEDVKDVSSKEKSKEVLQSTSSSTTLENKISVDKDPVKFKAEPKSSVSAATENVANDHQYYKSPRCSARRKPQLRSPSSTSSSEDSGINDDVNGNKMITLGKNNTKISLEVYNSINFSSCTAATRKLLTTLFDREVLANSSLTGKCSPAFLDRITEAKPQLDKDIVSDIVEFVTTKVHKVIVDPTTKTATKTKLTKTEVRQAITTKLADENKLLRKRLAKDSATTARRSLDNDEWTPKTLKAKKKVSGKRKRDSC